MRKCLAVVLVPLLCVVAYAEDGLAIQVTISEQANGSNRTQSYTNAILMRFDEEVSFEFSELYVFKVQSRSNGDRSLSLIVTLKDIIDGKPYYVGAQPLEVEIGESKVIEFQNYDTTYKLNLDTSFGTIPE